MHGGNALFLTVKTLFISNCTFKRNKGKGGALKVFNKFDDNQKIINDLAENDRLICIVNCFFDIDEEKSSSIYFERYKDNSKIEVIHCNFQGKPSKNAHYIDYRSTENNLKAIKISDCNFETNNEFTLSLNTIQKEIIQNHNFISSYFVSLIIAAVTIITSIVILLNIAKIRA